MDRSRQAVRSCCRHLEERRWGLPPGGGGGGGLQTGSGSVLEEEMPRPVAGLALELGGFVT